MVGGGRPLSQGGHRRTEALVYSNHLLGQLFFTAVLSALPFAEESSGFVALGFVAAFLFSFAFDLLRPITDFSE